MRNRGGFVRIGIVIGLILIMTVNILLIFSRWNDTKKAIEIDNSYRAKAVGETIKTGFEKIEKLGNIYSKNMETVALDSEKVKNIVVSIDEELDEAKKVSFVDVFGKEESSSDGTLYNISDKAYFKEVTNLKEGYFFEDRDQKSGKIEYGYITPLFDKGYHIGMLKIDLDMSNLNNILKQYTKKDKSTILLVDKDNNIILPQAGKYEAQAGITQYQNIDYMGWRIVVNQGTPQVAKEMFLKIMGIVILIMLQIVMLLYLFIGKREKKQVEEVIEEVQAEIKDEESLILAQKAEKLKEVFELSAKNSEKFSIIAFGSSEIQNLIALFGYNNIEELLLVAEHRLNSIGLFEGFMRDGENFIFIKKGEDSEVKTSIEKAFEKLKEEFKIEKNKLKIKWNAGVSSYPKDSENLEVLVNRAKTSLYSSYDKGEGKYIYFSSKLEERNEWYSMVEEILKTDLKEDALRVLYEPQIDVKTNQVTGFRASLKLDRVELGEISAEELFGIGEKIGLSKEMEIYQLRKVSEVTKRLESENFKSIIVFMPLSLKNLLDEEHRIKIQSEFEELQINSQYLGISFKEKMLIENYGILASGKLKDLMLKGFNLVMEEYGRKYGSITHLEMMSFSSVILDRYLIKNMSENKDVLESFKGITKIAKGMGILSVADGVESKEERDLVSEFGADFAMGRYFTKPLKEEEIVAFIKERNI